MKLGSKWLSLVVLLLSSLGLSSATIASGDISICAHHLSQITKEDYGVTTAGGCISVCPTEALCTEFSLETPVGNNDMKYNWETGDLIGGLSLKYKLFKW